MEEKKAIVFGKEELTQEQRADYQRKIAAAKGGNINALKGSEPLGGVPKPNIPDFSKLKEARSMASMSSLPDTEGVSPRPPGSPLLRQETEQQLKDMAKQAAKETQESKEAKAEEEKKEDKKDDVFDIFNFDQRSAAEKILDNKERRDVIEARCEPMKFEDLLYRNEVSQRVPVIVKEFEPVFRSITPEESLFIKKYISKEQSSSEQYVFEKYNLCLLTCSLVSINDKALPDHRNAQGDVDEQLFDTKLKVLLKKSGYIVADLGINYIWFDMRVRKLITAGGLKNG